MKSKEEIETRIRETEDRFSHVLAGSAATVVINAPRALQQVSAEAELTALYWALGKKFKSKLKGVDR